jgi:hypothetical protein
LYGFRFYNKDSAELVGDDMLEEKIKEAFLADIVGL